MCQNSFFHQKLPSPKTSFTKNLIHQKLYRPKTPFTKKLYMPKQLHSPKTSFTKKLHSPKKFICQNRFIRQKLYSQLDAPNNLIPPNFFYFTQRTSFQPKKNLFQPIILRWKVFLINLAASQSQTQLTTFSSPLLISQSVSHGVFSLA